MDEYPFTVRAASAADAAAVTAVHTESYGKLLVAHYSPALLDEALPLMTKANPVLLASGRYYVAEARDGAIAGCGGWSFERPGTTEVVPGVAHVRHVGTHPHWIAKGVARAILTRCIRDAEEQGAGTMEAYSTLAAEGFYRSLGFVALGPLDVPLTPSVSLPSVHMRRVAA